MQTCTYLYTFILSRVFLAVLCVYVFEAMSLIIASSSLFVTLGTLSKLLVGP